MEEEWRKYLRDNNPRLHAAMEASLDHEVAWRDSHINSLEDQLKEVGLERDSFRKMFLRYEWLAGRYQELAESAIEVGETPFGEIDDEIQRKG